MLATPMRECNRIPITSTDDAAAESAWRAACAEYIGVAIGWRSGSRNLSPLMRSQHPDGYYNLGADHGIASVTYLFGELAAAGIEPFECSLPHQRPGSASRFSSWIARAVPSTHSPPGAMVRWVL